MRHPILVSLCFAGISTLSACSGQYDRSLEATKAMKNLNVVDESNLNDVMLTVSDPNEGVSYFQRALTNDPDKLELQRGLATSLIRAQRSTEGVGAWKAVTANRDSTNEDSVELADAQIRAGQWKEAEATLNTVPPTHETFKRYRLEAMIADSNKNWSKADSFYETAVGLTTQPASVMNNWGFSKLTRGDLPEAERLFTQTLRQDPDMFTAKNNLVLARGAQGNYVLPVMQMTQIERAQLLHTLGLSAVKRGDVETGKTLFREAIDTHPQYFEAAVRSLAALESGTVN